MSLKSLQARITSLKSNLSVFGQGKTPIYVSHGAFGHYTYSRYNYATNARITHPTYAAETAEWETYYKPALAANNITVYPNLGCNDILGAMAGNTLGVQASINDQDYRTLVWSAGAWGGSRKAVQVNIENPWLTQLYYDLKQTITTIDSARAMNRGVNNNRLEPALSSIEREWKRQAIAGYAGFTMSSYGILETLPAIAAVDAVVNAIKANDSGSLAALKLWKRLIINLFNDCTAWCKGQTIPHYAAPGGTLTNPEPFEVVSHYLNLGFEFMNYQGCSSAELQQTPASSETPAVGTDYFYAAYQSASTWSMDSMAAMQGPFVQPNGVESIEWRAYHDRVSGGTVPTSQLIGGGYTPQGAWATNRYGTKFGAMSYMCDSQVGADDFGVSIYIFNEVDPQLETQINNYMVRKDFILVDGDTGTPTGTNKIKYDEMMYWWKRGYRDAYYNMIKNMHLTGRYVRPAITHASEPITRGEGGNTTWYYYNHVWGFLPDPEAYADILASSFIPYEGDRTQYVPPSIWFWGSMEFRRVRLISLTADNDVNANSGYAYGSRQWAERQLFGKPYIDTANGEDTIIGKLDAEVTVTDHENFYRTTHWGDAYWSTVLPSGSQLAWWTPSGGNQGPLVGLLALNDPSHPLYPYLSGEHGHGTTNVYGADIKAPQIKNAIRHYCTHWQVQHMTALRNKLKELYR